VSDPHRPGNAPYGAAPRLSGTASKPRILFERCPLCEGGNIKPLRTADCSQHPLYQPIIPRVMQWMRCAACAHVFTDGYFSAEVLPALFNTINDHQRPGWNFEQQRHVSARMVEFVAAHVDGGVWLDVGFGNGSLLFTAEEWGFTPIGTDLRPSSVAAMKGFGVESHCVDLAAIEGEAKFSVISMADVLEHMSYPKLALAAAHRLLRPGGILFASMPNYDCAAWRLLDTINANPYWGELEHYQNFSRARLYAVLREMEFEPLQYRVSERYRVCMEVIARRR
jgi:2-polyprenyl-3-methyl-5-hydroxy-6-metoxy-1,4-benzoquinol methylase